MSNPGYASFTVYRDGIITAALRLLRVIQADQAASSLDIIYGSEALNILLKNWQVQGFVLANYQQIELPCVANQTVYTIGPVGADLIIERPVRVFDGSFLRRTVNGVVTDTSLALLSRQGYEQITTKAVSGTLNSIYYEPSVYIAPNLPLYPTSPSVGFGKLYVYAPSLDSSCSVWLNIQRPVYDLINGGDEFDCPQEWFLPIKWGLAAQLADEYEVPEDRCNRLMKTAEYYRQQLQDWQHELGDVNYAERRQQEEKVQDNEKPR